MKKFVLVLLFCLFALSSVSSMGMGYGGRKKAWVGKRSYEGTLIDVSNTLKPLFGEQELDKDTVRMTAIWSTVGLVGALVFLFLCFLVGFKAFFHDVHPSFYAILPEEDKNWHDEQERKCQRNLGRFIIFAAFFLSAALLVQNYFALRYLVTVGSFDFMVFGVTPFWPFLGAFVAIAAVITLIFAYNMGLTMVASMFGFDGKEGGGMNALWGLILPVAAFLLIMLASLLNYIHINILPFSLKVLRLGCILLPVLAIIFTVVKKGNMLITLPYGVVCGLSLGSLGIIIAFYVPTVTMLAILALLGGMVVSFFMFRAGSGSGGFSLGVSSAGGSGSDPNSFSMDNMDNTHKTDSDGNEVFERKSDGKHFIHTATGFKEVDD